MVVDMDLGLSDKVAVILASTAGLGRAVADSLLAEGARVAISGRDADRLDAALEQLGPHYGDRVLGKSFDVANSTALIDHIETVEQKLGPIDILVWNSGGPPRLTASRVTCDVLQDSYRLLLEAAIVAIRAVLPSMRARGFGRIIAMTSIAVRQPIVSLALSNTMRSGLTAFLKSLSLEVAADGVLVNSICTGLFDTARLRALATHDGLQSMVDDVPLGRLGRPEEFGDFVAFLASERASYITGAALPIDGGLMKALL